MDKYPVYKLEIAKEETTYTSVDAIVEYFQTKIQNHPFAAFIAVFDHYNHTKSIDDCVLDENLKDAKNVVYCFGKQLPNPTMLAVRPRSIGVCELENHFEINFMEVPNPQLQEVTKEWVLALKNK
jgi:hypothetical protein